MQKMTVELHDSSSGGGRSKASDSHEYNRVSEICDRFLEQYSKPEDMPWRSELEKVNGQPIALLLY
jgi:hypothetical protein